jgi:plasmid stabilization system protein ParE
MPVLRDDNDEIIERKVPAGGFPYAVRYRILGDRLLVMAVLHQNRHPNFGDGRQA